jgi:hypothetical protein
VLKARHEARLAAKLQSRAVPLAERPEGEVQPANDIGTPDAQAAE